jgi:hypothetical protein
MATISLTGNDTIQISGRVLRNLGDGDVVKLTFPNELIGMKSGKNGNTVANSNAQGRQAEVELRLLRGSPDDIALQTQLAAQLADLPSFQVLDGYFVKRIGDGSGGISFDTYIGKFGLFLKIPEAAENVEGNTDPALAIYHIKYGTFKRANL